MASAGKVNIVSGAPELILVIQLTEYSFERSAYRVWLSKIEFVTFSPTRTPIERTERMGLAGIKTMAYKDLPEKGMKFRVRKASIKDLDCLVTFTVEEAKAAEGVEKIPSTLREGIKAAIEDNSKAIYWVIVDESNIPFGNVSALKEWSDWNAGYYWWIQSMYISPKHRGKGFIDMLVSEVKKEMIKENGLELRLYVHNSNKIAIRAYQKIGFVKSDYEIMIIKNY